MRGSETDAQLNKVDLLPLIQKDKQEEEERRNHFVN